MFTETVEEINLRTRGAIKFYKNVEFEDFIKYFLQR